MPRLLKITTLLMGLLLLTMTLGGTILRPNDPNERVPVAFDVRAVTDPPPLLQIWPGVMKPLQLTPENQVGLQFQGINPDGTTLYFSTHDTDYPHIYLNFWQVNRSGVQRVVSRILTDTLSTPDISFGIPAQLEWIRYALSKPDGGWEYWITHLPSGQRHSLSAWVFPYWVLDRREFLVTRDGRWLLLMAHDPAQLSDDVLRVDLQDGTWINLTAAYDLQPPFRLAAQLGGWALVQTGPRIYRLALDGTALEPLIDDAWVNPGLIETVATLDETSRLAVIVRSDERWGVEVASRDIIWRYDELGFGFGPTKSEGWVLISYNHLPARIHVPTGEIQSLPPTLDSRQDFPIRQTPDSQWLIYAHFDPTTQQIDWGRVHWQTHTTRTIGRAMNDYSLEGMSPDGHWLWLNGPNGLYRLRVRDGHMQHLIPSGSYHFVGWMRPFVRAWQPTPLTLISLALIIIGTTPRPLLQLLHLYPSSLRGH